MQSYNVLTKSDIDFTDVPKAEISCYKWLFGYTPRAYGQLLLVKDKGIALKMTAFESNTKAIYENYGDPVYEDSCLEFFVRFNKDNPLYMNFEMNSNGAFLASVRTDRKNKTHIHELIELPSVRTEKHNDYWSVETFFTFEQINTLFGKSSFSGGDVFFDNFYKCGDKTENAHYGMWSPVESENPDFHQPGYFGKFIII